MKTFTCRHVELPLSNGGVALIDEADAGSVQGRSWFGAQRGRNRYVYSFVDGKQVALHRYLLGLIDRAVVVDHINFDGLDNRRANLRPVSLLENGRRKRKPITSRTSRYKGVTKDKGRRWLSRIRVGERRYYLGGFDHPRKAAVAYNRVARRVFGPMAYLNEVGRG